MPKLAEPLIDGADGRDKRGRFAAGNKYGHGSPLAARATKLRSAALNAVSAADMKAIIRKLVEMAKEGDVAAAKVVLERCLGEPQAFDVTERLEELSARFDAMSNGDEEGGRR
jgi:hypothetical protein